jgi:hypothetical protein
MDRCDDAANLCCVRGTCAAFEQRVRSADDADRLLAALRSCVEHADASGGGQDFPCEGAPGSKG